MTTTFGPFKLGHHSHQGPRDTNQDTVLSIALPDDRWLLAVADGMGGLEEGERASKTALGALYRSLCDGEDLDQAVQKANAAVNKEAAGVEMGTTLVAAVVGGRRAEIVNVGDSRAYSSDALGLIQITRDHTMAEEAARDGSVHPAEVERGPGPWGNALARYLGSGAGVEPDRFGPIELQQGGWLLLSSDGLHGVMPTEEMESFLASYTDPQEAAQALVQEAMERGTMDNVSVVLAHWPEARGAEAPPEPVLRSSPPSPPPPSARKRGGEVLMGPRRSGRSRKRLARAVKLLLIVIPLLVAVGFLVNRMLSSTP